ncbi:MAG: hypothetical protein GY863_14170 [bacterium]|nr:hypothetical protein [bacterium]
MRPGRTGITISILLHLVLLLIFILTKYEFRETLLNHFMSMEIYEEPESENTTPDEHEILPEQEIPEETIEEILFIPPPVEREPAEINETVEEEIHIPEFLFSGETVDSSAIFVQQIDSLLGFNDPARRRFTFDFSSLDLRLNTREDSVRHFLYKLDSVFKKLSFKIDTYQGMVDAQKELAFKNLDTPNPAGQYGGGDLKSILINTGIAAGFKLLEIISSIKDNDLTVNLEMDLDEIEILELVWKIEHGTDMDVYSVLPFNTGHTMTDITLILEQLASKGILLKSRGKFLGKRFFFDPKGKHEVIYIPTLTRQETIDKYLIMSDDLKLKIKNGQDDIEGLLNRLKVLKSRITALRKQ